MPTPRPDQGGAYISSAAIDVGSGVVELGADTLYVDTRTGEVTRLQPAETMQVAVWTGEILIGLADRSDMWFVFRPPAGGWAESGDLAFPYPVLGE